MPNHLPPLSAGGRLELILGPMFSGKSTELIRRIKRHQAAKRRCLVIKYKKDTRYTEDTICTHDRATMGALVCDVLSEATRTAMGYEVVGVDEGQFFPDLVEFCDTLAENGKIVIVAALDGTFQRRPFGEVLSLIPRAEDVVKLSAICQICNSDASFSRRLSSEQAIEVIGGADKYIAVCRNCYNAPLSSLTPESGSPPSSPVTSLLSPILSPEEHEVKRTTPPPFWSHQIPVVHE